VLCGAKRFGPHTSRSREPLTLYAGVGKGQAASGGDVRDLVLELQVRKANTVSKAASIEIQSYRMNARVVLVGIDRIAQSPKLAGRKLAK